MIRQIQRERKQSEYKINRDKEKHQKHIQALVGIRKDFAAIKSVFSE